MATPTVSAGYRRRLGRNEPLGAVPNGSFLLFHPSNGVSQSLWVTQPFSVTFAGWFFNAQLDRLTVTVSLYLAVFVRARKDFFEIFRIEKTPGNEIAGGSGSRPRVQELTFLSHHGGIGQLGQRSARGAVALMQGWVGRSRESGIPRGRGRTGRQWIGAVRV